MDARREGVAAAAAAAALREELAARLRRKADTHDVMGRHAELTEKLTAKVDTTHLCAS